MEQNFWLCALANQTSDKTKAYELFTNLLQRLQRHIIPSLRWDPSSQSKASKIRTNSLSNTELSIKPKNNGQAIKTEIMNMDVAFPSSFLLFLRSVSYSWRFFLLRQLCISHTSFAILAQNSSPSFFLSFRNQLRLLREFFPLI